MSKKQSSIEWLENEINRRGPKENNPPQWLKEIFEQAKAMHKKEIEEAYYYDPNSDEIKDDGEEYYKETFGGQDNE